MDDDDFNEEYVIAPEGYTLRSSRIFPIILCSVLYMKPENVFQKTQN